ncbi:MAG TPA: methyltransferase domain-containing protein [Herpetosiphonaceae bacterium]
MQYDEYAALYDRSGQLSFSVLMELYLRDLLRRHPVAGRALLDLACGTGTLAVMLAEQGWQVVGIDRSAGMLAEARRKAAQRAEPLDLRFVQGDMRDFALARPVDLVTCCYDTLNYLIDEADLRRCLEAVARSLVPGGLFCFDLATDYFLEHYWQGVEVEEFDAAIQVMQSHYDRATGHSTLVLTGFIEVAPGRFRRFREVHVERGYPQATVRALLEAAGFAVEGVYDCFTMQPPNERSLREMYVARRVVDP